MPLRGYDPVFREYIRRKGLESEARNLMKVKLIIEPGDPEWYEWMHQKLMKESQKDWML